MRKAVIIFWIAYTTLTSCQSAEVAQKGEIDFSFLLSLQWIEIGLCLNLWSSDNLEPYLVLWMHGFHCSNEILAVFDEILTFKFFKNEAKTWQYVNEFYLKKCIKLSFLDVFFLWECLKTF